MYISSHRRKVKIVALTAGCIGVFLVSGAIALAFAVPPLPPTATVINRPSFVNADVPLAMATSIFAP
jgi:hypothetical protein